MVDDTQSEAWLPIFFVAPPFDPAVILFGNGLVAVVTGQALGWFWAHGFWMVELLEWILVLLIK